MRGSFLTGRREVKTGLGSRLASIGGSRFFDFDRDRRNNPAADAPCQPSAVRPPPPQLSSTQPHADPRSSLSRYGSPRYHRRRYDSHGLLRRVSQGPRGEDNEHNESGGDTTEEETK